MQYRMTILTSRLKPTVMRKIFDLGSVCVTNDANWLVANNLEVKWKCIFARIF